MAGADVTLENIQNQEASFLSVNSRDIYGIKVSFSQDFFQGKKANKITWIGKCSYYLAFNTSTNKFYRLGGFDKLDIVDFFNDLSPMVEHKLLFDLESSEKNEIDFFCLKEYSEQSEKKKRKKKNSCFETCSETLTTKLILEKAED